MSTETIRGELEEYRNELSNAKSRLEKYRSGNSNENLHTDQSGVLLVAIEGLQTRLTPGLSETIELVEIVKISDDIQNVLNSTEQFLKRKSSGI